MIAPRAAARPRGQDDATSRASQTGAHEAHSGPEEHAPLAPTPGFRGVTLPPSFERSSTTSSPLRAREHAGSHARQDGAAEPGLARDHGADPRKAAVRLPEIGSFEALEVPENARCAGREPPLFSLSGGRRAPPGARLPCRPTASARRHGPPHAYNLPKGGGVRFSWPRARPRVPGAVSEWVSFRKPSSPAIRNRTPNRKPSTRARSVLFGK
jgi:hypothetical protein